MKRFKKLAKKIYGAIVTPGGGHALEHEARLRVGEHGDEQLVHVHGLDEHPGQRRQQQVVTDDSDAGAESPVRVDSAIAAAGQPHPTLHRRRRYDLLLSVFIVPDSVIIYVETGSYFFSSILKYSVNWILWVWRGLAASALVKLNA